jgi:hypothetical protein
LPEQRQRRLARQELGGTSVARLFRFLEKKRGRRRTGSNLLGSVGEAVFCGTLFLLGTLSLSALIANQVLQPDPGSFALGVGRWLLIMVMASLVILGGGGLIWTVLRVGTSAERRNVMARQASDIDLMPEAPRPRNYPTLPPYDGLTNSPGIELSYRLPPTQSPGWRLLATTIFTMVWNIVVCLLTVLAISSYVAGHPDWFLTVFLAPFWAVSTWSIRYLLQLIWLHTGMGLTTVEISDLPLVGGQACQAVVAQHGHIAVKSLQLWLVCEEEATYSQGTDIRTESRVVVEQMIFERGNFRIEPAVPFQHTTSVAIPAMAMHSFHTQHNSIRWKLVVRGEATGWPVFERGFPIVIYPGEATLKAGLEPEVELPARRGGGRATSLAGSLARGASA